MLVGGKDWRLCSKTLYLPQTAATHAQLKAQVVALRDFQLISSKLNYNIITLEIKWSNGTHVVIDNECDFVEAMEQITTHCAAREVLQLVVVMGSPQECAMFAWMSCTADVD